MKGEANMEQNDAEIKKALSCCVKGDCFRCPLYYVHNCRTALREGMNNILNKQQIELVLKRNTINDLNNKLTEKQSENEKLQSLCTSKDVIIKEQQAEIEKWKAEYTRACAERDARICTQDYFKSEAIKEFAERLKSRLFYECGDINFSETCETRRLIDNLLAEMVGGMNEKSN